MSDLVQPEDIERIVGVQRSTHAHIGRAVSNEQTVYILHSQDCKDSGIDLRECPFSYALDRGIHLSEWEGREDRAVTLRVRNGRLIPWNFR